MAIELVTGKAGVPHVDSEDVGAFNAHSLGSGAYIMDGCEVTAKSANIVSISAGEILWEGRHIRVKGSGESLAVDNGQTGYNRRDLITLNYAKDPNGIESASFKVVKGTATTGTAADPSVKVGSILAGDTSAVIPFARITLSGLSVAAPTVLLGSLPSLVSLRDSVSQVNSAISKSTGWTYLAGSSAEVSQTTGYVRYRVNRFNVELDIDYPIADASDKKLSKLIPASLRPYETCWFAICATKRWNKSDHMAYCEVKKDGTVWIGRGGAEAEGRVVGSVSWVIP